MRFFVYGTLMDADIRREVLGPAGREVAVLPAVLRDAARRARPGSPAPVLVPRPGGRVPGLLLEGVGETAAWRMAHFEGPAYVPTRTRVWTARRHRLAAWVFVPAVAKAATRRPWDFHRWRRVHKPAMRREVRSWMVAARPGNPLALDVGWRGRRVLRGVLERDS